VYLQIPAEYCRWLGGLRWAHYGEAVEFLDGPAAGYTFAFAGEIALFLQGLEAGTGTLPDFGFVLHLLYLTGLGDRARKDRPGPCLERIARPFRALGCPLRNAGALCGWLARGAPASPDRPGLAEVHELLTRGSWIPQMVLSHPFLGARDQALQPRMDPEDFELRIRGALESLPDEEIRHWLRHGRAPQSAAYAQLLSLRPSGLIAALAQMDRHPRLAGVSLLADRLESALCLPPRQRAAAELQYGGYSDVATRGSPEQILPVQFALDREEFLRRFAERELLYFHREEPSQPTTEELVLLLDQGVRTWGEVRLVLSGAALALVRKAQRKQILVKLAATSEAGDPVDPAQLEAGRFLALLEAADLSADPSMALATLIRSPHARQRDLVLLTHRRNLAEPAVTAAARLLDADPGSRLFAVSLDAKSRIELAELRHGMPVALSHSRVEWPGETACVAPHAVSARRTPWKGDVEPIGFPFRCGVLEPFETCGGLHLLPLDFDDSGERVLALGRYGLSFAWLVDGSDVETLQRPIVAGPSPPRIQTVIGVMEGLVLVGQLPRETILAHYDFAGRVCSLRRLESTTGAISWFYYRDLHALAGRPAKSGSRSLAVDLLDRGAAGPGSSSRAAEAARRADRGIPCCPVPSPERHTAQSDASGASICRALELDPHTGALHYCLGPEQRVTLTPRSDGRPALKGGRIIHHRQGGDVLAALVGGAATAGLYFISLSRAALIGLFPLTDLSVKNVFALSRDGHRFAFFSGPHQLQVRDVPGDRPPLLVTSGEDTWVHFATLGRSFLLVREFELTGPRRVRFSCLLRWDQPRLDVAYHDADALIERLGGVVAESRSLPPNGIAQTVDGAPPRFVQVIEHGALRILIDRYNHIAVLGSRNEPVCMFYVSRGEVAAWLADGTCWGSRRLIGGEAAPGAAARIAAALRAAESGVRISV
jgi:hypothetical protein